LDRDLEGIQALIMHRWAGFCRRADPFPAARQPGTAMEELAEKVRARDKLVRVISKNQVNTEGSSGVIAQRWAPTAREFRVVLTTVDERSPPDLERIGDTMSKNIAKRTGSLWQTHPLASKLRWRFRRWQTVDLMLKRLGWMPMVQHDC